MADAFIAPLGENLNPAALALARELRHKGLASNSAKAASASKNPLKPPKRPPAASSSWAKTSSNPVSLQ